MLFDLTNAGSQTLTIKCGASTDAEWPGGTAPTFTAAGNDIVVCETNDSCTSLQCVGAGSLDFQ